MRKTEKHGHTQTCTDQHGLTDGHGRFVGQPPVVARYIITFQLNISLKNFPV